MSNSVIIFWQLIDIFFCIIVARWKTCDLKIIVKFYCKFILSLL